MKVKGGYDSEDDWNEDDEFADMELNEGQAVVQWLKGDSCAEVGIRAGVPAARVRSGPFHQPPVPPRVCARAVRLLWLTLVHPAATRLTPPPTCAPHLCTPPPGGLPARR